LRIQEEPKSIREGEAGPHCVSGVEVEGVHRARAVLPGYNFSYHWNGRVGGCCCRRERVWEGTLLFLIIYIFFFEEGSGGYVK